MKKNYGRKYLNTINIIIKNMRTKFLHANEAFNCILHELRVEGIDFGDTKALFNVDGKSTFKEEFVTCGGISLKEIDFGTMGQMTAMLQIHAQQCVARRH